jgi:hypothetical protein
MCSTQHHSVPLPSPIRVKKNEADKWCFNKTVQCSRRAPQCSRHYSCAIVFALFFNFFHTVIKFAVWKMLNFWSPPFLGSCSTSPTPSLHLLVSQTYWHASLVQSQQRPQMNNGAVSMQEHSFMINITIHKSVSPWSTKHGIGRNVKLLRVVDPEREHGFSRSLLETDWWGRRVFSSGRDHQGVEGGHTM